MRKVTMGEGKSGERLRATVVESLGGDYQGKTKVTLVVPSSLPVEAVGLIN